MNKDIIKEYAELKLQEKTIKARIEQLNPLIVEEMVKEGVDKVPTTLGSFSFTTRKKWTYTDAVKTAEEAVKTLKTEEEQLGLATSEEQKTLTFVAAKPKENSDA